MAILGCIGFAFWQVYRGKHQNGSESGSKQATSWLSKCDKNASANFTHAPMDMKDVSTIIPAGSLAGAHVTPIDHLYFYPQDMKNRDAAPVYAMADGYIVHMEERKQSVDTGKAQKSEYQLYFQNSCSILSYFDLLTSLDPSIAGKLKPGANLHVPVKAGQVVGRVGAQSLDTAIYNMDKTLPGFVNASSYSTEPVKLHLDDFFTYFKDPVRSDMLARNVRKSEPFGGKIDYDIDGKLRGNWFREGTNGYAGAGNRRVADSNGQGYWSGHLAIVPDAINENTLNISLGDYQGQAKQFTAKDPTPDPASVDAATGIVKYELTPYQQSGPSILPQQMQGMQRVEGVVLLQMTGGRTLKMETFPGKTAEEISGFTSNAQTYVR